MAAQMLRLVVLCEVCTKEFEFDWSYDKPKIEDLSLDKLAAFGVIGEKIGDDIASGEIANEVLNRIFHEGPKQ